MKRIILDALQEKELISFENNDSEFREYISTTRLHVKDYFPDEDYPKYNCMRIGISETLYEDLYQNEFLLLENGRFIGIIDEFIYDFFESYLPK